MLSKFTNILKQTNKKTEFMACDYSETICTKVAE